MLIRKRMSRRRVLRGFLDGAAVSVALPLLDCFLNDNATALANGLPLPVRFGTWYWGLGMNKVLFTPDKVGADYDLKPELAALAPVKKHINLFSNYRVSTDGRPSLCHYTGWVTLRCGQAPSGRDDIPNETIDVTVADAIGGSTRFPTLEVTATGSRNATYSFRSAQAVNPPEVSALALYEKIFGADYQDPNAPTFKPNPKVMTRRSVLSAVREDSAALRRTLGAADRQRLDQYFTSLRSLEDRLALQLQKPPPMLSCRMPSRPAELPVGLDADLVAERHRLMTDVLVTALACNQTRVFNMAYADALAATTKNGVPNTHHSVTHEEPVNAQGFQETHSWFVRRAMESWAYFVGALENIREGEGSLLDHTLVFAHSDHDAARVHSLDGIPMMTAGRAGGRLKSGWHIDGHHSDTASDVGLTLMRAMGVNIETWGQGAMKTDRTVSQILT